MHKKNPIAFFKTEHCENVINNLQVNFSTFQLISQSLIFQTN